MDISKEQLFQFIGNNLYPESEFYIKDSNGTYIYVNQYFQKSSEYNGLIKEGQSLIGLTGL